MLARIEVLAGERSLPVPSEKFADVSSPNSGLMVFRLIFCIFLYVVGCVKRGELHTKKYKISHWKYLSQGYSEKGVDLSLDQFTNEIERPMERPAEWASQCDLWRCLFAENLLEGLG